MNSSYPTVATIIGCPEELKSADGLVATPLVIEENISMPTEPSVQQLLPDDTSVIKDPVQKAIVDNILGKVSTKATPEKHRCDLCNVEVNGKAALLTHLSGARHAKKLKEETLNEESQSPYIEYLETTKMYHCKLCNATLNARIQIMAHLQGSKHRTKAGIGGEPSQAVASSDAPNPPPKPRVKKQDPSGPNLSTQLFCATCRLYVNSEVQLQQHVASKKHLNKQNNAVGAKPRHSPYPMKSPRTTGSYRVNTVATRQTFTNSSPSTFQRRTVNSSYDSSIGSYSLSSSFVSSGIYGNGQGYSNHQPYSRNSYQTHTYG